MNVIQAIQSFFASGYPHGCTVTIRVMPHPAPKNSDPEVKAYVETVAETIQPESILPQLEKSVVVDVAPCTETVTETTTVPALKTTKTYNGVKRVGRGSRRDNGKPKFITKNGVSIEIFKKHEAVQVHEMLNLYYIAEPSRLRVKATEVIDVTWPEIVMLAALAETEPRKMQEYVRRKCNTPGKIRALYSGIKAVRKGYIKIPEKFKNAPTPEVAISEPANSTTFDVANLEKKHNENKTKLLRNCNLRVRSMGKLIEVKGLKGSCNIVTGKNDIAKLRAMKEEKLEETLNSRYKNDAERIGLMREFLKIEKVGGLV